MTRNSLTRSLVLRWHEVPLLAGLTILWMALWREVSWMSLVSGLLVSLLAMRVFYLPPIVLSGRFNPWWAIRYLIFFFWHIAVASMQVGWLAVRPRRLPQAAIIAVPLRSRSDFILTMVGATASLIPGSLVTEVDRFESILYLHVLNTPTAADVEAFRTETLYIEELLIRTLGSRADLERLS